MNVENPHRIKSEPTSGSQHVLFLTIPREPTGRSAKPKSGLSDAPARDRHPQDDHLGVSLGCFFFRDPIWQCQFKFGRLMTLPPNVQASSGMIFIDPNRLLFCFWLQYGAIQFYICRLLSSWGALSRLGMIQSPPVAASHQRSPHDPHVPGLRVAISTTSSSAGGTTPPSRWSPSPTPMPRSHWAAPGLSPRVSLAPGIQTGSGSSRRNTWRW